jgi:hypothetical protein
VGWIFLLYSLAIRSSLHFEQALACSTSLMQRVQSFNRRTMDLISAKVYGFYALLQEKAGNLADLRGTRFCWCKNARLGKPAMR